ncbi:DUF2239 family protein [Deinococcus hopiensis]|uniref:DUF2239 domain-containing protein n=1 Tax=Deinococcus hopiensis KR-140 TaxID=695939 RepID=A0A1W1UTV7_9DEIO|nr:DUF2239 family protein [Deinococcus hopiensis]SMB84493.1 hypothetical protein SAMN00790413_05157 [Deinococcus hopiensis KR-140]
MTQSTHTAFYGERRLITAPLADVLAHLAVRLSGLAPNFPLVLVNDGDGRTTDFDLRGNVEDILRRALPDPPPVGARPVRTPRSVTLLPRHWDWLNDQPEGSGAVLRRLMDEAMQRNTSRAQAAQEAAQHFMTALAGNLPYYQAASRALYAGQEEEYERFTRDWPDDIRAHALHLAAPAFISGAS